jgi:twitching motility protein PilT
MSQHIEDRHETALVEVNEGFSGHLKHVDEYLNVGMEHGASDIHLAVNAPPIWRRYGHFGPIWDGTSTLSAADTQSLAEGFLNEEQWDLLRNYGNVEFAYHNHQGRFRASAVRQRLGIDLCFRIINTTIRTMDELKLPQQLKPLTSYHNGLILVTGPVGSGKSTTLAALVDYVNEQRHDHIITLEDPIEYLFQPKGCHISQREVHHHTKSFGAALRAALREDPDVIMVGEMRDLETIQLAITAAETGHLVLGTLHTASAARTLDRVLDVFPTDQRDQIRIMVSESLRGVISQQLVPRADGEGRVLAMEILMNNAAVANLVREGKTFMLPGIMQVGKKQGMQLMDDALQDLYSQGMISKDSALLYAEDKQGMKAHIALHR